VLTIEEAAQIFKVSKPTIYRWAKQDKIKSRIVNGIRYYDIDGLQNAFEKRHTL
jgi:excisionase family DNA binding protein